MATSSDKVTVLDVYARVSRASDDRERSTEGQVEDCKTRIAERGAQVGDVHVDSSRSAWNPKVRRPGWDRLMDRLESGQTGGVVVFDLARFSRRPIEGERLIDAAERGLQVLDDASEYNLTTPNGKKQFRDQMNTAAYESDRLSSRVKRGKRLKAMRGEANVSFRPFGFEDDGGAAPKGRRYDRVRESEAVILRDLADRFLAGESQDALIRELNERGITTATGGHWTRAGLRQVLTRPRNAGLLVYDGKIVEGRRLPGEPILTEDAYNRVVAMYDARRRGRPASDAYLCSGLVLCGLCQHPLTGRPRANMAPYPDGSVRRQYWCQPRSHGGGCGRISIDQREVDRHVGSAVVAILADPRRAAEVESVAMAVRGKRRALEAEIAEAEELAGQLADRLGRGEITLDRYDRAVGPLDRRLADLQRQRDELDANPAAVTPEVIAASREQWQERWEVAAMPERRSLLRQALYGSRLLVRPADPSGPRRFDPARIVIEGVGASH